MIKRDIKPLSAPLINGGLVGNGSITVGIGPSDRANGAEVVRFLHEATNLAGRDDAVRRVKWLLEHFPNEIPYLPDFGRFLAKLQDENASAAVEALTGSRRGRGRGVENHMALVALLEERMKDGTSVAKAAQALVKTKPFQHLSARSIENIYTKYREEYRLMRSSRCIMPSMVNDG